MLRFNPAALDTLEPEPEAERRRVTIAVEVDVEGCYTDEEAAQLVRDTLIVDCWVGDVVREEVIQTVEISTK